MLTKYAELGIRRRAAGYDALTMIQRIKAAKRVSVGLNENKQLPQRVCERDCSFSRHKTGSASKSLGAPFVFKRQCTIDHSHISIDMRASVKMPDEHAVQRRNCQRILHARAAVGRP